MNDRLGKIVSYENCLASFETVDELVASRS